MNHKHIVKQNRNVKNVIIYWYQKALAEMLMSFLCL